MVTYEVPLNRWQLHTGQNIEQLMRCDYVQDIQEMKNGPAHNFFKGGKGKRGEG